MVVRKCYAAMLCVLVLALVFGWSGKASPAQPGPSRIIGIDDPSRIRNQFIVVLESDANPNETRRDIVTRYNAEVLFNYDHAIKGFSIRVPRSAAEAIAKSRGVRYVEADRLATGGTEQLPVPSWGLDRVDQRELPLDDSYTSDFDGSETHMYIIDSGVRASHSDFEGRASLDFTAIHDGYGADDCHGHGTHVAGTAAGTTYGIAKEARVHSVRVLDCNGEGTYSGAIEGVDWVANNHIDPAVANMSIQGSKSPTLNDAVNNSVNAGVFYAVAAGNHSNDACNTSPASAAEAYTVGASDTNDNGASFTNFGTCVNIFAPGVGITSLWNGSDSDTNTMSGTSMSSPHVAGIAALFREANRAMTPDEVAQALTDNSTKGILTDIGSESPNRLLFLNHDPKASFTWAANELTVEFDASSSSDPDGSVVSYDRDFGDGNTSVTNAATVEHAYQDDGSYPVTLTVFDDQNAAAGELQDVQLLRSSTLAAVLAAKDLLLLR